MKTIIFIHIYFLNKWSREIEIAFKLIFVIFVIGDILRNRMHLDFAGSFFWNLSLKL